MGLASLKRSCNAQLKAIGGEELARSGEDLTRFAEDPVGLVLYIEPDVQLTIEQIQILESVRDRKTTNVQAAHGVGKTWIASWIVMWYVFCVRGKVLTTAPVARQVRELLWGYIRKLYDRHSPTWGGRRTMLMIELTEDAKGSGFSTDDYNENTFQGSHQAQQLIVFDEANGISYQVDDGAAACLTGEDNRMLRIGNPTSSGTPFEKACRANHIRIPCWSHPNVAWAYELHEDGIHRLKPDVAAEILRSPTHPEFKDEPVKPQKEWDANLPRDTVPGAVSVNWIERIRGAKHENSPYWQGRVEGLFPEATGSAILPQSWFLSARARFDLNPPYWDWLYGKEEWSFGLDVGDGGDDHCIVGFQGPILRICKVIPGLGDRMDTIHIAKRVAKDYLDIYGGTCGVDRIGVGAGTLAWLLDNGYSAWGATFGEAAESKEDTETKDYSGTFLNWKAEAYWTMRDHLAARHGDDISAIALTEFDGYLRDDLSNTYYEETDRGTRIEDKKKTIARLGRSPNAGDAAAIAYMGLKRRGDLAWRSGY